MLHSSLLFLATAAASDVNTTAGGVFNAYFANWAQYHKSGYSYTASDLAPIAGKMDMLTYAFAYFCPAEGVTKPYWITDRKLCDGKQPFDLIAPEPKDPEYYKTVTGFKQQNSNLKVVLSIGGWNFPSAFFSQMVSTQANRAKFIQSATSYMNQNGFDGIDIDWEYPCSAPRTNPIKMDCETFNMVRDDGSMTCKGSDFCSGCADRDNLLSLVKEMRASWGTSKIITVAGQAGMPKASGGFHLAEMAQHIDYFNIMSYDYSVSDIPTASHTAPNMGLYNTSDSIPAPGDRWGIDYTVSGYLAAGVPKHKIVVGLAFYGHSWYVPGLSGTQWQKFGLEAKMQGQCCGPFGSTYGAKSGQGCSLCGSMMYSEIQAAGCATWHDSETKSDVQYCEGEGKDGYTASGTWTSYCGKECMNTIVSYVKEKQLAGAFAFDTSMDSHSGGSWSYELMNAIADGLH